MSGRSGYDNVADVRKGWNNPEMADPIETSEAAFYSRIDCRFPYADRDLARALIAEGWTLSPDAAFGVLHEICRKPHSEVITKSLQYELVDEWLALGSHPLQHHLLPSVRALIEGNKIPWRQAVAVMEEIAQHKGQYAALNIASFSGECDNEGDTQIEAVHDRITAEWT